MASRKSSSVPPPVPRSAAATARALLGTEHQLVLAESCTGGLAAASLVETPGISTRLCGSFVVYQIASKQEWLGLPAALFKEAPDAASGHVSAALARAALQHTPHATIAAAITGRLGPSASAAERKRDGVAWISVMRRTSDGPEEVANLRLKLTPHLRQSADMTPNEARKLRVTRQKAATAALLDVVRSVLSPAPTFGKKELIVSTQQ